MCLVGNVHGENNQIPSLRQKSFQMKTDYQEPNSCLFNKWYLICAAETKEYRKSIMRVNSVLLAPFINQMFITIPFKARITPQRLPHGFLSVGEATISRQMLFWVLTTQRSTSGFASSFSDWSAFPTTITASCISALLFCRCEVCWFGS